MAVTETISKCSNETAEHQGVLFRTIALFSLFIFTLLIVIPLAEALGRTIGFGVPGSATWIQHFVLWLGFWAAILTTIQKRHLCIGILDVFANRIELKRIEIIRCVINTSILFALALAGFIFVRFQIDSPERISTWFPLWMAQAAMPIALVVMAWATIRGQFANWKSRFIAFGVSAILCFVFCFVPDSAQIALIIVSLILVILFSLLGMPIYALVGGAGILLFYAADVPIAALPVEAYRLLTQPVLPSIPLFTLAGTVLAAGGAPKRLINLINAWTSWMPGGPVLASVFGCAVFTAITGASGVTILALGSLLLPVLLAARYEKKFSVGLLTSTGSIGLLFPPSLPVILFGVYAHVAIDQLFLAALVPGILLIVFVATMGVVKNKNIAERSPFDFKQAIKALWGSKGDFLLPFFIIFGFFGGFITLVETAALTALWAILLETVFYRSIKIKSELPKTIVEASVLSGALLIVLGLAGGFSSYIVDMQIPMYATEFVLNFTSSKYEFLLILNVALLLVGAFMDIYSAIVIVVPLIVPIALAFGINPVHLGVIFLANLELGYLTPPIGMNLFLSSLRFNEPLLNIWKTVVPFLFLFLIWVLLITYVPFFTVGILDILRP